MSIMFDEALVFEHKLRERCNVIKKELEDLICEAEGRSSARINVRYNGDDEGAWEVSTYSVSPDIKATAAELTTAVEQFKQVYFMQRAGKKLRTLLAGPSSDEVHF